MGLRKGARTQPEGSLQCPATEPWLYKNPPTRPVRANECHLVTPSGRVLHFRFIKHPEPSVLRPEPGVQGLSNTICPSGRADTGSTIPAGLSSLQTSASFPSAWIPS